jgi:hypothetical protein
MAFTIHDLTPARAVGGAMIHDLTPPQKQRSDGYFFGEA